MDFTAVQFTPDTRSLATTRPFPAVDWQFTWCDGCAAACGYSHTVGKIGLGQTVGWYGGSVCEACGH